MNRSAAAIAIAASLTAGTALAAEGPVPTGIPALDHVFVIMMENHGYPQIIGNPYAPFINSEATTANLATNYFAVAHPSLTNYLEVNGGSNFGVLDDNVPDWHNAACQPNLATGVPSTEAVSTAICPIAGTGTEAGTPAIDYTNETSGPPGVINVNGKVSYRAATDVLGETIADQLASAGKTWKSYQESLPPSGADQVDYSDGFFTNLSDFSGTDPSLGLTTSAIVQLYAAKHDPFVYFASLQAQASAGQLPGVAAFDGYNGLFADLASGNVPNYAFVAPNQCDDQHGRGGYTPFCAYDPNDNGTQVGLNPALIQMGDVTVQKLVTAIKGLAGVGYRTHRDRHPVG